MKAQSWPDSKIIADIKQLGIAREQAIRHVYFEQDWMGLALMHVLNNKGEEVDGKDLAQDAITAFERNIREEKFNGNSSLKTYFMAIVKFQWLKKLRDRKISVELKKEHYEKGVGNLEELYVSEEKKMYTNKILGQIGGRCQQLLILSHTGYSLEEIAKEIGLSSSAMAKKEVHRCRERMRNLIKENPGWLELLT